LEGGLSCKALLILSLKVISVLKIKMSWVTPFLCIFQDDYKGERLGEKKTDVVNGDREAEIFYCF
jgi:hypothetical protein